MRPSWESGRHCEAAKRPKQSRGHRDGLGIATAPSSRCAGLRGLAMTVVGRAERPAATSAGFCRIVTGTPPRRKPMLEVTALRKSYGDIVAVDGVSLKASRGETIGLLGPNGAGKTTTVSMIAGLLRPDSGTVVIARRGLAGG